MKEYKDSNWLHRMYVEERKTLREIASICGTSHPRILQWMKNFCIPRRDKYEVQRRKCPIPGDELGKLYQDGKTLEEIGDKLGVNKQMVKRWMERLNIPIRSNSEASKLSQAKFEHCKKIGFEKGHEPWNKDKRTGQLPAHSFPKGHAPWNKGKSGHKLRIDERIRRTKNNKISKALSGRRKSAQHIKNWAKAVGLGPSKPEMRLSKLLQENLLPFEYVGDGKIIIDGLCPDFINCNGKKQIIELFGIYWHDIFDVAERIERFKQYGFKTLIIWENELENQQKVLKKIKRFSNQ